MAETGTREPEADRPAPPGRRLRVLVVDDERGFAVRLARTFEEAGFEASALFDGTSTQQALEESLPDLVVLDVRMPAPDGIECLRRLHAQRGRRAPPVILLTGDTTPRVDAASLVHPGCRIVTKPCDYETVVRVAQHLLASWKPA